MKSIRGVLFLFFTGAAYGQAPADGFYLSSADESAPSVLTQDGKRISLGPAQDVVVDEARIYAQDNANSLFWVSLSMPREVYVKADQSVLVVANRGYPWVGRGMGHDVYSLDFKVSGDRDAREVSRYLKAPIAYRKHPRHELRVSFVPSKLVFRPREDVRVTFRIENVGTNAVAFEKGGQYRGSSRDNQYTFSARLLSRQVDDVGSSNHHGGISVRYVLAAGEVFEDEVSLSKWFAFDEAGRYEVLGTYDMTFWDAGAEPSPPIWTDYVSGEFVVTIAK